MTKFMVQWEDHPSHLATRLGHLLEHQTLVDVTLMCNTHTLRVHRAVLAAGSPYFETILMRQLGQHPLIVLKDMQFSVLKSLIEFMYCGETSVSEENLPALLQAAKFFQVRGLSSMTKEALGLTSEGTTASLSVTVNGEPSDPPSTPMRKAFVRPPKRVNIQSVKKSPLPAIKAKPVDKPRVTFHTVAKTIPTTQTISHDSQADNAQLLLSLSGLDSPKTAAAPLPAGAHLVHHGPGSRKQPPAASRSYRLCHDVSGVLPARAQPNAAAAMHGFQRIPNSSKRKGRPQKPSVPNNKKLTTALEMALAREKESREELAQAQLQQQQTQAQQNIVYQDTETNTFYQVEGGAAGVGGEEEENVIYQLPDGTITDKLGNPILDKDGNSQNIMNYQLAGADAAAEGDNMVFQMEGAGEGTDVVFEMDGLPADMPILLDNGDGNYVAVGDDTLGTMEPVAVETPAEKEAETITGDMYEGGEEHSTTYVDENGHPVTVEHYDGSEDPQAVYADGTDDPQATYVDGSEDPQTAYVDGSEDPQAGYVDGSEDPQTTYVDGTEDPQATFVDGTEDPNATFVDGTEDPQATYVDETTSAFTDDAAAATQEEFTEPDAAISDETYAQAAGESEVMFETEPEDAFAEAAPESETMFQNDPVAAADNYDETEPAIVEDPYNGEPVAIQYGGEPVATDTFHASEIAEDRFGSEITGDQFGSESTADQFGSETANTVISEGYETASTDYIAYEADKPEMSVEQALEEMMGEESGDGNVELRRVLDEVLTDDVPNGTSSLLKNALQQSGIVSEEHGSLKGALTYQISHVDGKQQVRITGVSDDVKSPSKDIPFAVGLLPLQDALQKLQAMPDHQPRKTRSYDDAANRNKRKNSGGSDGGPEKRILLTEDWKIMEDKEEEESATKNAEEMSND